jgi:hypothetical protein
MLPQFIVIAFLIFQKKLKIMHFINHINHTLFSDNDIDQFDEAIEVCIDRNYENAETD